MPKKHWCHETKGVNPLRRVFGVAGEAMERSKRPGLADGSESEKTPWRRNRSRISLL